MNKYKILIAGGDMRQIYCAERLSKEFEIRIIGFDRESIPDSIKLSFANISSTKKYDCIVLPVSPIDDNGNIYTPCSSENLHPKVLQGLLTEKPFIFTGQASEKLKVAFQNAKFRDYLQSEELNIKNAIPTAEGAIQLALEELPVTLNGLKVLVVGMGRIGSVLVKILQGFGADISTAIHSPRGSAKARLFGVKTVSTKHLGTNYDLVFNTVPKLIFDRNILERFNKHTLFIDLASKPGGIDFEAAHDFGLKIIWALSLPGKTAPVTSGEIIAETISSMLEERNDDIE